MHIASSSCVPPTPTHSHSHTYMWVWVKINPPYDSEPGTSVCREDVLWLQDVSVDRCRYDSNAKRLAEVHVQSSTLRLFGKPKTFGIGQKGKGPSKKDPFVSPGNETQGFL